MVNDRLALTALRTTWRGAAALLPFVIVLAMAFNRFYRALHPQSDAPMFQVIATLSLAATFVVAGRACRSIGAASVAWLPAAGFVVVMCALFQAVVNHTEPSIDFSVYQHAAEAVIAGQSPYFNPAVDYTYPPAYAWTLGHIAHLIDSAPGAPEGWTAVFVGIGTLQVVLACAIYVLLFDAAVFLGLGLTASALLITSLVVVNAPIGMTVGLDQVNLLLLALVLIGVRVADSRPELAGLCLAVGGAIKIYPLFALPGWWASRRRKAVLWCVATLAAIALVVQPFDLWMEFVRFWLSPQVDYPRGSNSTIFALLATPARLLKLAPASGPPEWLRLLAAALAAGIAVWACARVYARCRAERWHSVSAATVFLLTAELLAFGLLISPRVWPHQFVLAMPLVVYAAARVPPRERWLAGLGALLMFATPWLDLSLVGLHRLVGLVMVLYAVRPSQTRQVTLPQRA